MVQIRKIQELLDAEISSCFSRREMLEQDGREDEANFEKIRANVFGIFRTVSGVAEQQPEPLLFFRKKLQEIPENWRRAEEKAKQHGADDQASIEAIKLAAADRIRGMLEDCV